VSSEPLRLLVIVGTDHHPFDRVVRWVDSWLRDSAGPVTAFVQHGSAAAPTIAAGSPLMAHAELQEHVAQADVVVTHGGPATIMEVRRHGRLPVVVPRDPRLGEHVDGHQQLFARRLGDRGLVRLCEDEAALRAALDQALGDRSALLLDSDASQNADAGAPVRRVGEIIEEAVAAARGGSWRRRLPRLPLRS
jgi:UDP-N-acetylglucosamine transferase subunit ALG13